MRNRSETGKFVPKSASGRQVKTIRVTEEVWKQFGEIAEGYRMTRADLLELWVLGGDAFDGPEASDRREAIAILEDALTLKANAGGAIKEQIRYALTTL